MSTIKRGKVEKRRKSTISLDDKKRFASLIKNGKTLSWGSKLYLFLIYPTARIQALRFPPAFISKLQGVKWSDQVS